MADNTKEQVRKLLNDGVEVKDIAEQLGKTKATIYVHKRNIEAESGDTKPRKRGRPPKLQNQTSDQATEAKADEGADESKPKRGRPPKSATATANGHDASRFPMIREAIVKELEAKRRDVAVLEKMLETA